VFDIGFYMKVYEFKQEVMNRQINDIDLVWHTLESFRNPQPVVYNIETTNACNMRCEMCPRTTMMTRPIETLDMETFERVVDQIRPFSSSEWQEWQNFVEAHYGIKGNDMSENHFFLHVIPKVLVLHGYGDPLLDRQMPKRVSLLSERGIPSYFSCNPANINIDANLRMFENGLGYIKYSIESTDDVRHKEVRGQRSNFTNSYQKILQLLDMKDEQGYKTVIVVTMLNLNKPWQQEEFQKLRDAFSEKDVYVYLKSQDTQWYQGKKEKTPSIHWSEFCQFPWSSMTIKSNGEAAMCVEDFNNEIILGDAKKQSLCDIWNGEKYRQLRHNHLMLTRGIRCTERCDMSLVGSYLTSLA
jgi:MoaA/NifB/PqqE/SkfB family radical SAM enzyme